MCGSRGGIGKPAEKRAQGLVSLADKAKSELLQEEGILAGTISIGCGETASVKELAEILIGFQSIHPQVKFELYSSNNEDIKERMERGHLDVGLLLEPVNVSNYSFIRMKTKEVWGALVHQSLPLAKQEVIKPGDLVGTLVITYHTNTPVHNELVAWSGDFAKEMDFSATYNALYNAVIVAREKKGAVICLQLESNYDDMKFISFAPRLELSTVLVWKEQVMQSRVTSAFLEYIKRNTSSE